MVTTTDDFSDGDLVLHLLEGKDHMAEEIEGAGLWAQDGGSSYVATVLSSAL